jgi:NADH-quinone oxidoreductase subunit C
MSNNHIDQISWVLKKQITILNDNFSDKILNPRIRKSEITIIVLKEELAGFLLFLKQSQICQYKQLIDIATVDILEKHFRFSVNYLLLSVLFNTRITVRVKTDELLSIHSMTNIFKSADWLEREVWDLYGIFFQNHKDLRRILTDYGFKGHPLRKEFPLSGFLEVYYNDEEKRIVYEGIELAQEYRAFNLQNNWKPKKNVV